MDKDALDTVGVLLQSAGADVISYDDSGLTLRLSNKVITDISLRLPKGVQGTGGSISNSTSLPYVEAQEHLPDVEAWNLKIVDDWLFFTADLPGKQGVRGFRRPMDSGDILADASGPLQGILGLGGARAALAVNRPCDFPQHIAAPADDIGPVGHAGVETAQALDRLEQVKCATHEVMVAENLLITRQADHRSLPLFVTRVETDTSASASALAKGAAQKNLQIAARNLTKAAAKMGKKASISAITLNYSFEDQSGSASAYRDGMLSVMSEVENALVALGFHKPAFITQFDGGTADLAATDTGAAVIQGQWDLGWNHGDHRFIFSAPSYMFELDSYDRPTDTAKSDLAAMTAAALSDPNWQCPIFMLAEIRSSARDQIRVTAKSNTDLIIDEADPLSAGAAAGFYLSGVANAPKITGVALDPDDPKSLILTCDQAITGDDLMLAYGFGLTQSGGIRDQWAQHQEGTGSTLHRWALPCLLPLQAGAQND